MVRALGQNPRTLFDSVPPLQRSETRMTMSPQAVLAQPFTLPNGTVIRNRLF